MGHKKRQSDLNNAIMAYITEFEHKHEAYFEFFISDDILGIVVFGDSYFNVSDIIYDIDTKQEPDNIWDWYYASVDRGLEEKSTMNYETWCKGLRYSDIDKTNEPG